MQIHFLTIDGAYRKAETAIQILYFQHNYKSTETREPILDFTSALVKSRSAAGTLNLLNNL